ncbi:hypothetical protein DHEL01_v206134 [Diaporthe helianthi]|uniref:Uncharacterized protein n=1 Tax=Diaporthe helianthi TaxID=158607 RepID=A0A2P5HYY8_DIAHE|nr:hypothetical protein DHEL01_v206134 [Diaporthe helianthi]
MHQLQNFGQEQPIYDGKSYAFSSTYHDGTLKLYAHHLTAPTTCGGQPEYHMTQLDTWGMTGNIQSFIRGVTAFRNLRDLAKQHRDTFIQQGNFRYQQGAAAAEEGATTMTQVRRADAVSQDATVDCHLQARLDLRPVFLVEINGMLGLDDNLIATLVWDD